MNRRSALRAESHAAAPAQQEALGVGYLMSRARASLLSALDRELEPFGLSAMQFAALKHVTQGDADTAAGLCRFMYYDGGSMTRLLDKLEERGLLRRERGADDRRVVYLRVSANGRALLPRLKAVAARVLEAHLAGFSASDTESLKTSLKRMIENGQTAGDNLQLHSGGKS